MMLHPVVKPINSEVLRHWPLPMPSQSGDKQERGRVLVIGGSREMPGAAILAATAALRAGAVKLTIATSESTAQSIALMIPEARVIGLPEGERGGFSPIAVDVLERIIDQVDAILIGPGMQDEAATVQLVGGLLPKLDKQRVVLDACAIGALPSLFSARTGLAQRTDNSSMPRTDTRILITPYASQMAHLTGVANEAIVAAAAEAAYAVARHWHVQVVLKGGTTFIASPIGPTWRHDGGSPGLGASGSGDTLAGLITGLAARGATLEQAGAWGVTLHAHAGDILAERFGPLGYRASELAAEIPHLMHSYSMHAPTSPR